MTAAAQRIAKQGLGTPGGPGATRALLLGSGELGKEVAIELQRLGVEVIAYDRYANAPAMQVAHRAHVLDMRDATALGALLAAERPDLVIPEIEAIATEALLAFEAAGNTVVPTARAAHLTMNREGIRQLAAQTLGLPTSPYRFAETEAEYLAAIAAIGTPCVVKPVMSSSGKGQSTVRDPAQALAAWQAAQQGARGGGDRVIVEGFVEFDFEITLLTVRHVGGTGFCAPIGHRQVDGDYHESWQPQAMSPQALANAEQMAAQVTEALGGYGLFGVEFFIKDDAVIFSEVSPRPHDTGMVTMISQDLSEFALHARAILGLPVPEIRSLGAAASAVILGHGHSNDLRYRLGAALAQPDTQLRLFGKPELRGERRLGVALALGTDTDSARALARDVAATVEVAAS